MLVLHFLMLLNGALRNFTNVDEVGHLPAGVSHWLFGRFDLYRVSPPLLQVVSGLSPTARGIEFEWLLYSDAPGMRPEFAIGRLYLKKSKLEAINGIRLARIFCIAFPIFAACLVSYWVNLLFGRASAHVACGFWCFCPNLVGGGQTIIPDVGSVAVGVLACFAYWDYGTRLSYRFSGFAGVCLGTAMLCKLTWVTAIVSLFMTTVLYAVVFNRCRSQRAIRDLAAQWVLSTFVALCVLNAGYLFEGTLQRLGDFKFCSEMFGGEGCTAEVHGNKFKGTWLADLPVPVPQNYLLGIDYLKHEVEERKWSFLQGEWRFGSWPHYYIMTTLYKTPEPTLLGALIGLGVLITGIRKKMVEPKVVSMFLFLIIPAAVCFASVSLQGGFNHHHRYVLMIYPPMFALAAYIASPVGVELLKFRLPFLGPQKRSIAVPLAITLAVLSAASSLRVHPYYTSYFNTLSGGPENGWRLLGFSNIDWGQDILEVDKWLKAHPERRPLVMDIDYFGMNGDLFDVPTTLPPQLPKGASIDEVRRSITETQWWIISVKRLYNLPGHKGVEYLQQIEPVERIAYAYHVYRIDPLPKAE